MNAICFATTKCAAAVAGDTPAELRRVVERSVGKLN
jgi:hypothetical protein